MTSADLASRLLPRLKRISPRGRWQFLAARAGLWLLFLGTAAAGALAFFLLLGELAEGDLLLLAGEGELLPLAAAVGWLAFFLLLAAAGEKLFRATPGGWRRSFLPLLLANLLLSTIAGAAFFASPAGKTTREFARQRLPFFRELHHRRMDFRERPGFFEKCQERGGCPLREEERKLKENFLAPRLHQ
jgi:hypothetical protein